LRNNADFQAKDFPVSFTPGAFAAFLAGAAAEMRHHKHQALEEAAKIIEKKAKALIGTHEANWPPLQPETIARKATGDSPLLETGELRNSIEHTVSGDKAYVGSNSPKAIYQFLGTSKIPARDPLVPAAMQSAPEIVAKVGKVMFGGLVKN
jgi:phage gpG-like protein